MKKALLHIILALFLFFIPQGCLKDDRSDCIDEPRLILHFEYFDYAVINGDSVYTDLFDENIHTIDVLIFDQNQDLYTHLVLGPEVIPARKTEVEVEAGEYYIVCWANHTRQEGVLDGNSFDNFNLDLQEESTIAPLYYAPDTRAANGHGYEGEIYRTRAGDDMSLYRVVVAPADVTEHTMSFMSAHRRLEVTIVNFPDVIDPEKDNPTIWVNNQIISYGMDLRRGETTLALSQQADSRTDTDNRMLGYTSYRIPHFDNDNPIHIMINGTDGNREYEVVVPMTQVLEELYPDWELYDGDNRLLKVEIDWNDGVYVKLSIARWKLKHVSPGFE